MNYTVRSISTEGGFAELAPEWSRLLERSAQPSPFLSHDWFACCWLASAPETRPEVLVVEEAGRAVAMVPLRRWRERIRGLPLVCIGFLESPDTAIADIVTDGDHAKIMAAVLQHLRGRRDWDVVRLRKLPASSPTVGAVKRGVAGRFAWRGAGTLLSPYVAIDRPWTEFWNSASPRFKKTVRNVHNKLARAGKVSIEQHRVLDADAHLLDEAINVSRRSWKAERGVAIATMRHMPEFFGELSRRASARGWLSLWFLRLNDLVIATEFQLQAGGVVHALRADYDVTYGTLSPGAALHAAIVKALFERGDVIEYDMGPGLNDYKMRWATGTRETVQLDIYATHTRARIAALLERVVMPAASRFRDRWVRRWAKTSELTTQ
jgi:CelD/BcsL family acetyltransferase involved in cellulose biosynthesis